MGLAIAGIGDILTLIPYIGIPKMVMRITTYIVLYVFRMTLNNAWSTWSTPNRAFRIQRDRIQTFMVRNVLQLGLSLLRLILKSR